MKAKSILLLAILCGVAFCVYSCGGGGCTDDNTTKVDDPEQKKEGPGTEPTSPISKMIIYIDASASVKGYFSQGSDGKFGNAITALAQYKNLNSPVYFWGSPKKVDTSVGASGGVNTALMNASGFGQDSYFNQMFKEMKNLVNKDSVDVACLVTDGIYGVGNNLTAKDPEQAIKNLPDFKGEIKNVFSEKEVAVGIYKLPGKFSSKSKSDAYITYQNTPVSPIEIDNRPFYVILIGKKEQVLQFEKDDVLKADLKLTLGAHNMKMHNACKLTDIKHFDKENKWKGNKNDSETNLVLDFPPCMGNDKYLKANTTVLLNGNEIKDFSISDLKLTISKEMEADAAVKPGKNSFEVIVKNTIPEEWKKLYTEDDKNIKTDKAVQTQTFGLQYLLEGILEGTGTENLMDIKFDFTK